MKRIKFPTAGTAVLIAISILAAAGGCGRSEMEKNIEGRWYVSLPVEADSMNFNVALMLDLPSDRDSAMIVVDYTLFNTEVATCSIPGRWSVKGERLTVIPQPAGASVHISKDYMALLRYEGYSDSALLRSESEMLREAIASTGDAIDMTVRSVTSALLSLAAPDGSRMDLTRTPPSDNR